MYHMYAYVPNNQHAVLFVQRKKETKTETNIKVNCRKSKVCVQQATETAAITLNSNLEVRT